MRPVTAHPRVLVLFGRGRYQDPWHDTAATSRRVAAVLSASGGCEVVVRGVRPDALADLAGFDLLVVNTASGGHAPTGHGEEAGEEASEEAGAEASEGASADAGADAGDRDTTPRLARDDARWAPFHEDVRAWADAGRPVLVLHQGANTFADSPHWERILGGRWVDGESMHPPIGPAAFLVAGTDHPIGARLVSRLTGAVTAVDERYSYLRVDPGADVILTQVHDGVAHPVVWAHQGGGVRVVYDGLGHDVRSYDSASRRALLRSEIAWLIGA